MPIFVLLILLGAGLLWLLMSFVFVPLGKIFCLLWDDAREAMFEDE